MPEDNITGPGNELIALAALQRELLHRGDRPPRQLLTRVAEVAQQLLGARALIIELRAANGFTIACARGDWSELGGHSSAQPALRVEPPLRRAAIFGSDALPAESALRPLGASLVVAPVLRRGRQVGLLIASRAERDGFTPANGAAAELLASLLGNALGDFCGEDAAEKELEERLRVADRMASVSQLAAGVAHELNNPLAFMLSNLAFLKDEVARLQGSLSSNDAHELSQAVSDTLEGAERARTIVRELQSFAQAQVEHTGMVDLVEVLAHALDGVQRKAAALCVVERELERAPAVCGHPGALLHAFSHLLVNALDALPAEKAPSNRIRVTLATDADGWARVEISDTGEGIPDEVRARMFDPFFTTKQQRGVGLGLSVAHSLLTAHGAEVTVQSTAGVGTTFKVRLPPMPARAHCG